MARDPGADDGAIGAQGLALYGGPRAIVGFEGTPGARIGVDEFMALAELWGFSAHALGRIRDAVSDSGLGVGPSLGRWQGGGPSRVEAFENLARQCFGSPYALAVHSGTSALEVAYAACGVGPACEVIIPAFTFLATATAAVARGAVPVLCEVDESLTMDPQRLDALITPRTKAIVPVHMLGGCADMHAIMELADQHGIPVVEDAAQACGGRLHGRALGTFGAAGCFSISSYKRVGAGEGGLVLSASERIHQRALNYHDTAGNWRPDRYAKERFPGELFCGTNLRMSELEGAVNAVQLGKMEELTDRLRDNKRRIVSGLGAFEGIIPRRQHDPGGELASHLVFFAPSPASCLRTVEALAAEGLPAWGYGVAAGARDWHIYAYWEQIIGQKTATGAGCPWNCPLHDSPRPAYREDECPRTLDLLTRAVLIDIADWWTERDCDSVATAIAKVLEAMGHISQP